MSEEKRHGSGPRTISATHAQAALAAEGHAPVPDDEPTNPEICAECGGKGLTVEEKAGGGYRGPVPCPRGCKVPGARS